MELKFPDGQLFVQFFFGIQELPLRSGKNLAQKQAADLIAMNHFDMSEDLFMVCLHVLCLLVDGLVGTYLGRKFLRYVCVRLIVSVHLGWFLKHLTCA